MTHLVDFRRLEDADAEMITKENDGHIQAMQAPDSLWFIITAFIKSSSRLAADLKRLEGKDIQKEDKQLCKVRYLEV